MQKDTIKAPDQPSTIAPGGGRRWIFPTEIHGYWQSLRRLSSLILLVFLYSVPWLKVNGEPFLRLSFLSTSFVMFGSPILMHEFYHFVFLALLMVMTLFIASAIIGRVWCGFACPQTIFIEQILGRIDRFFEGSAAKRQLDSKKPWTFQRVIRRIGKLAVYALVSFSFAFTLVALFTGPEVILQFKSTTVTTVVTLLTLLAWFDAAYWREQFCHIVCPYARFQGVMQDAATRTIGYDVRRGEPRAAHKKQKDSEQKSGDCIDCGLCVRVCPSGIDIRQGATQQECIACARCIDACDGIMTNVGRPKGLIRYDALAVFEPSDQVPKRPAMMRPRVLMYGAIWMFLFVFGLYQFLQRQSFHAQVLGAGGAKPWFVEGDRIKNLLSLKIGNQSTTADMFTIAVQSKGDAIAMQMESPSRLGPVLPGQELSIPLLITVQGTVHPQIEESIVITSQNTGEQQVIVRKFVVPSQ